MLELSKPLLAQPDLLLQLSDPELIRVVCSVAAFLGFFAALLSYPAYTIRRPRSTNPALLLGLALFVASAVGPMPVGASFLLVGAWACWGVRTMGGNAAAMGILYVSALARRIRADILRAYRSLLNVVDDLRDGSITLGGIGLAVAGTVSKAATLVLIGLTPFGILAACNALVIPFLDPTPSPTRQWLVLGGAAVALVASASTVRWVRQALFPDPSDGVRLRSWADQVRRSWMVLRRSADDPGSKRLPGPRTGQGSSVPGPEQRVIY